MESADGRWFHVKLQSGTGGTTRHLADGAALPAPVQSAATEDNPISSTGNCSSKATTGPAAPACPTLLDLGGDDARRMERARARRRAGQPARLPRIAAPPPLDGTLYFSSDRTARSRSGKARGWAERMGRARKVAWVDWGASAVGLGEPTLTADGEWLYFVVVFVKDGGYDADVARVARLP